MNSQSSNSFVKTMQVASNFTTTENGALTNASTLNPVLDWFGAGGALRTRPESDIERLFANAWAQDRLSALKILFYFRDVRGGQGERRTFRTLLKWLAVRYPEVVECNIENIPFYGRWDDLYALIGTPVESEVFRFISAQLRSDLAAAKRGESVSLLAKWLKSENTSSRDSRRLGNKTRRALMLSSKEYRKTLSRLRNHIGVLERQMCSGDWSGVNYEQVPSKAAMNYRKAFERHDSFRYSEYLKKVQSGEAKINAGAVYPYEIVRSILRETEPQQITALDLQWKAMPNWLEGNEHKGLVLADMSGSMFWSNNGLPAHVALSLAVYFAERNVGPFQNVFLSFSIEPKFHTIKGNNLREKIDNMDKSDWDGNTDLQAAFDAILKAAVENRVAPEDMPSVLYIVSDMEHDSACSDREITNFDAMRRKFVNAGYALPKVVWWNVDSRNDNFPIRSDATGTALVSGCSPSILKSLLSAKSFNPMDIVYETINAERYNRISV